MTIAETYAAMARMFDYPVGENGLNEAHSLVRAFLEEQRLDCTISPFAAFLEAMPLAAVQEEYVATFDFNPATAPYLGHHLFGDNQKKAGYMVRLKQEYSRHAFVPEGCELPDHLAVILEFLSHLARHEDEAARKQFIDYYVLLGVQRLRAAFDARQQSPWRALVEAAEKLCIVDCMEVAPC
jgi:nitrate reductase delta subunit